MLGVVCEITCGWLSPGSLQMFGQEDERGVLVREGPLSFGSLAPSSICWGSTFCTPCLAWSSLPPCPSVLFGSHGVLRVSSVSLKRAVAIDGLATLTFELVLLWLPLLDWKLGVGETSLSIRASSANSSMTTLSAISTSRACAFCSFLLIDSSLWCSSFANCFLRLTFCLRSVISISLVITSLTLHFFCWIMAMSRFNLLKTSLIRALGLSASMTSCCQLASMLSALTFCSSFLWSFALSLVVFLYFCGGWAHVGEPELADDA